MLSDIEIAQAAKMQPITEIAAKLGLQGEDIIPYGHYKAPPRPVKARPPPAWAWPTP